MRIRAKAFYLCLLLNTLSIAVFAQVRDSLYAAPKAAIKLDTIFHPKEEIIVDGKRYRVHNNWLNVGSGEGFNTVLALPQYILNVDMNFHFHSEHIQLGTYLSGDRFLSFNNYNIHLCYGKRWEDTKRNIFVCGGPSYSYGFPFSNGRYSPNIYNVYGFYAEAQYIYKLQYDLGIGLSAFADVNNRQSVGGIRVELYFSGSYRGLAAKNIRGK
jgi:hypothetical protein